MPGGGDLGSALPRAGLSAGQLSSDRRAAQEVSDTGPLARAGGGVSACRRASRLACQLESAAELVGADGLHGVLHALLWPGLRCPPRPGAPVEDQRRSARAWVFGVVRQL